MLTKIKIMFLFLQLIVLNINQIETKDTVWYDNMKNTVIEYELDHYETKKIDEEPKIQIFQLQTHKYNISYTAVDIINMRLVSKRPITTFKMMIEE